MSRCGKNYKYIYILHSIIIIIIEKLNYVCWIVSFYRVTHKFFLQSDIQVLTEWHTSSFYRVTYKFFLQSDIQVLFTEWHSSSFYRVHTSSYRVTYKFFLQSDIQVLLTEWHTSSFYRVTFKFFLQSDIQVLITEWHSSSYYRAILLIVKQFVSTLQKNQQESNFYLQLFVAFPIEDNFVKKFL